MTTQVLRNKVIEETQRMIKEELTYLYEEIYEMNPKTFPRMFLMIWKTAII